MQQTSLEAISHVSRISTHVVDRIFTTRSEVPLVLAQAIREGLKAFRISSQVFFGKACWIEILEDHSVLWAGAWREKPHFWVSTQFGEIVDLQLFHAYKTTQGNTLLKKPISSPPNLWSKEIPKFCKYQPEGTVELEFPEDPEQTKKIKFTLQEVTEKCLEKSSQKSEPDFFNEPLLCPGRQVLDDQKKSFQLFDRVLSVRGFPPAPF